MNSSSVKTLNKQNSNNRSYAIDLLKTISIFGVIIIHNCTYNFEIPSPNFTASIFWGSLVRASVPIFLMCSGALLLSPDYKFSIKKFYSKNVLRIIISMLVWAMSYKIYHLLIGNSFSIYNVFHAFKEVLLFNQEFHLYFLRMILLVYVFLPITRIITKYVTKMQFEYLLALWFVLGILLPTVISWWPFNLISGAPKEYIISKPYAAIGYSLFGYYLNKYPLRNRAYYILLAVVGCLITFGGTYISSLRKEIFDTQFFEGMSLGVCFMAGGIFGLCFSARCPKNLRLKKATVYISKASFCIYLSHVFFNYTLIYNGLTSAILPTIIGIPLVASIVFICSIFVYMILSRIPIVRDWII